jgi:hypothetical protein
MRRSQKILLFLSIVVPMGLLVTFRLSGFLKEPMTISETVTVEAVLWELERPDYSMDIDECITSSYNGDGLSVAHVIHILDHKALGYPSEWGGCPVTEIRVNVTADVEDGYVVEVYFESRGDNYTGVNIFGGISELVELDNLTVTDYAAFGWYPAKLKGDLKCFIKALGVNNPKHVRLSLPTEWIEASMQYQSHQIEGSLELTYFNGTAYKKVVFPSVVRWIADGNNNSFDTAQTIQAGTCYSWLYFDLWNDPQDYYNFSATQGQRICIKMVPPAYADHGLFLYSPNRMLRASLNLGPNQTGWINFIADSTGSWFIKANTTGFGFYSLELSVSGTPLIPSKPSGPTYVYAIQYYSYSTSTIDPDGNNVLYEFDWGDGTQTQTSWKASGTTATIYHYWKLRGIYEVKVRAQDTTGKWSNWSTPLIVNVKDYGGGGGGGCPILYVWNGFSYICEGLLDIHDPDSIDVVRNHTLISTPQYVYGTYLFRMVEHPKTHSYIDQVKLYALLNDEILIELPLIWAWHSEYGNVLPQLLFSDEWKTETKGAEHNNGTSQSINLKFAALPPSVNAVGFIFQIEGNNDELK